jgi:hypothetical protein
VPAQARPEEQAEQLVEEASEFDRLLRLCHSGNCKLPRQTKTLLLYAAQTAIAFDASASPSCCTMPATPETLSHARPLNDSVGVLLRQGAEHAFLHPAAMIFSRRSCVGNCFTEGMRWRWSDNTFNCWTIPSIVEIDDAAQFRQTRPAQHAPAVNGFKCVR